MTVCYADPEDERAHASFRAEWEAWDPDVPLVTLHAMRRSLGPPVAEYLQQQELQDRERRVVVLIPEVQPEHWWMWVLHNQRGVVLNRAITHDTDNVVICRLRFRLAHLAPDEEPGPVLPPR